MMMSAVFSRRDVIRLSAGGVALPLVAASPVAHPALNALRRQALQYIQEGQAPSLSVAVFREGRRLWVEAFGFADRGRRLTAKPGTRYAIASASKPFTATAVAQLPQDGAVVNKKVGGGYQEYGVLAFREQPSRHSVNRPSKPFGVDEDDLGSRQRRTRPGEALAIPYMGHQRHFGQL